MRVSNEIIWTAILGPLTVVSLAALFKIWLYPIPAKVRRHLAETIREVVHAETETIKAELRPNHGASLRDAVDRLRQDQLKLLAAIQHHSLREWAMRGFEHPLCAFFQTDSEGKLTRISRQVVQWTGKTEQELHGNGWASIIDPTQREAVKRWWATTWADGSYGSMDQRYIGTDGKLFNVRVFANPVFDMDGSYIGHVGSITRMDNGRAEAD